MAGAKMHADEADIDVAVFFLPPQIEYRSQRGPGSPSQI
jgi:hypothetical protein